MGVSSRQVHKMTPQSPHSFSAYIIVWFALAQNPNMICTVHSHRHPKTSPEKCVQTLIILKLHTKHSWSKQKCNLSFAKAMENYQISIKRRWIIVSYGIDPAKYHVMIAIRLSIHALGIVPCSTFVESSTYIRV